MDEKELEKQVAAVFQTNSARKRRAASANRAWIQSLELAARQLTTATPEEREQREEELRQAVEAGYYQGGCGPCRSGC